MNNKLIIFGASGFIGHHLIEEASSESLYLVTRNLKKDIFLNQGNIKWVEADLLNVQSLERIITPGSIVVNLAYSTFSPEKDNIKMTQNLIQVCLRAKIAKLIHCSTAVVVGENSLPFINEDSECFPTTAYEKIKLLIEQMFLEKNGNGFEVCILRPTAVIGPGGQNLKKILDEIRAGNEVFNFIRSLIYGKRRLNLVPVKDVVRAIIHLYKHESPLSGIFICSADDDPHNRFDQIEEIIRDMLNKKKRIKLLYMPSQFLELILSLSKRGSARVVNRFYSSEKLLKTGFKRTELVSTAVRDFVLSELQA